MKRILIIIIGFIVFFSACTSARYHLKHSNYDMATRTAVKKLRKKPGHAKSIEVLKEAYPMANSIDLERIKYLNQDGSPDRWGEIFERYNNLKNRQTLIKSVLPAKYSQGQLNFNIVDYDKDIISAKHNAADYFYANGQKLLKTGDKFDARKAYAEFKNVKDFYSSYKDIDNLLLTAKNRGISHVLIKSENNTIFKLPASFISSLIPVDLSPLNSEWVEYSNKKTNQQFDYYIDIQLNKILLSPATIKEKEYTESKEIEDGWEYVLDENGNVKKDSLGNDIKQPKIITISCKVRETIQRRDISLQGRLLYNVVVNNKVLKEVPFGVDNFFENRYATANGDLRALKKETQRLLDNRPVPFPQDMDMIFTAGERLKNVIRDALRANKRVPD
ncbi:MAG: hypothetical protein GXO79_04030 [Chlorobi bacterium]|nr:hypothetical protein [Chlorobiota bacterium]